jgi:heme A synthase
VTSWLHRFAVLVAAFTLFAISSGAWVTSNRAIPVPPTTPEKIHLLLGSVAAGLIVVLALWLFTAKFRALGGALLVVAIAQGGLGETSAAISHAIVAQILLALVMAAMILTSKAWQSGPDIVLDQGWPSLRSMSVVTPVFVMAQVTLGAGFRHKAIGLTWHIVGAMVVALTILIVGMCVMQAYPTHRALRPAALMLLCTALAQVLLGIATITAEMVAPDNAVPTSVILSTIGHVTVGAITLTASLMLAMQVRRNVQKPIEEAEEATTERAAGA